VSGYEFIKCLFYKKGSMQSAISVSADCSAKPCLQRTNWIELAANSDCLNLFDGRTTSSKTKFVSTLYVNLQFSSIPLRCTACRKTVRFSSVQSYRFVHYLRARWVVLAACCWRSAMSTSVRQNFITHLRRVFDQRASCVDWQDRWPW